MLAQVPLATAPLQPPGAAAYACLVNAATSDTLDEPITARVGTATPSAEESAFALDSHPERLPLRRAELLLIFGFWTLIAILTAANFLLDPRGRGGTLPVSPSAPIT